MKIKRNLKKYDKNKAQNKVYSIVHDTDSVSQMVFKHG